MEPLSFRRDAVVRAMAGGRTRSAQLDLFAWPQRTHDHAGATTHVQSVAVGDVWILAATGIGTAGSDICGDHLQPERLCRSAHDLSRHLSRHRADTLGFHLSRTPRATPTLARRRLRCVVCRVAIIRGASATVSLCGGDGGGLRGLSYAMAYAMARCQCERMVTVERAVRGASLFPLFRRRVPGGVTSLAGR